MQSQHELKSISQSSRKRGKKHENIMVLTKTKLNTIDLLISKPLIDSYISHDEFASVKNVLRKYNKMKEEIKSYENIVKCTTQKQWESIVLIVRKILQAKVLVTEELNKLD